MSQFFENIYHLIQRTKTWSILLFLIFFAACFFFATRINLEEDITKIIPKGDKTDITAKVIQQLNFSDKIAVMVHLENDGEEGAHTEIANLFIDTLSHHDELFSEIQGKVELDQMEEIFELVYDNLPLFLDSNDYAQLEQKIAPDSLKKLMQQNYNMLISPAGMLLKQFVLKDPLGMSFIGLNKLKGIGVSDDFQIIDGFITSSDGKTILLFITPKHAGTDTEKNEVLVDLLYSIQETLNEQNTGKVEITYFGAPFIALANAQQIKRDIQSTVLISMSILMLVLIFFYRNFFVPLILFLPVVCGALFAAACIYFMKDSVSAISMSIGAVLLGITLDYPLHIITHYRAGATISSLYKHITKPILSSSLTTAAAFLCLLFVNSEVLRDLGIFAAISVLISALSALVITPHIYKPKFAKKPHLIDKISRFEPHTNKWLFTLSVVFIVVGFFTYSNVRFNNNLVDLNFVPDNMKRSEAQLEGLGSIGAKSIYVVAHSTQVEDVVRKNHELEKTFAHLKNQGLIEDYTSMGSIVLPITEQERRAQIWEDFWQKNEAQEFSAKLNSIANELGFKKDFYEKFSTELYRDFAALTAEDYLRIDVLPIGDFFNEKDGFYTFSSILKIDETNRESLFETLSQENLIIVDRKHLNEQFLGQLKDDFLRLMNLSFVVIFIIMLLFFRRLELALMAMIPIVCTGLITAGTMALFNIELNVFSTIVTTLILGLGIDFSIFMTSGLQMKYTTGKNDLPVYRTSILLAVFTTVLALGTLVFAKHPALTSISWASLIGVLSAVFMTFVFYPVLFNICIEQRPLKGKSPASLRLLLTAVVSYLYYGVGGVFYSIFGVFFMRFVPIKKDKKERWYRRVIAKFIKSVMYTNPGLTNRLLNPSHEQFEKPAIIIANHSSFLDTLSMGFIKTPFIFLVNDWVYNSPIFGKAVQLAGYYPVSSGIENGEQNLMEFMEKGYSLVIFPEGTRSPNRHIGRFHKGAFHLAKTYNIDIVPVYIHGNGDLVPKGDFIIYDGRHTLVIGERIAHSTFENQDVKTITKNISSQFKMRFNALRRELENEDYFKKKIKLSFLYKTNDVARAAAAEFEKHKSPMHHLNEWIPRDARIQRIGDDLGIIDLLLCLQEPIRNVRTYIVDEDKAAIAQQNYLLKTYKINYSNTFREDPQVLMVNTKFAQHEFEHLIANGNFDLIIIDVDAQLVLNMPDYEANELGFGFTLFKKK